MSYNEPSASFPASTTYSLTITCTQFCIRWNVYIVTDISICRVIAFTLLIFMLFSLVGSIYRDLFSEAILSLQETEVISGFYTKWWTLTSGAVSCDTSSTSVGTSSLPIANVGGIFVILAIGVALSIIVAICEFIWNINLQKKMDKSEVSLIICRIGLISVELNNLLIKERESNRHLWRAAPSGFYKHFTFYKDILPCFRHITW